MSTEVFPGSNIKLSKEEAIYKTLDVFSHGASAHKGLVVDEEIQRSTIVTTSVDIPLTLNRPPATTLDDAFNGNSESGDTDDNGNTLLEDSNDLSEHDKLVRQTGAVLYHGDACPEKEAEDEVEVCLVYGPI